MPPTYTELKRLVEEAAEKLRKTEKLLLLKPRWPLLVIGDIHGDAETLEAILGSSEAREAVENGMAVFLGDYVDRGPSQVEVVAKVLELLVTHENVYALRGNHEPPPGLDPYPHDFPQVLVSAYGVSEGRNLYQLFRNLFDELPYAAIIEGFALLVHGGPPTWVVEERYGSLVEALRPRDKAYLELLEQVLWNDPAENVELWAPSPRGAGFLWGWRVTEATLSKGHLKYVIRGHEAAENGFKLNHGGRVLTLFSRLGPPYFNRAAAYLYADEECTRIDDCVRTVATP